LFHLFVMMGARMCWSQRPWLIIEKIAFHVVNKEKLK